MGLSESTGLRNFIVVATSAPSNPFEGQIWVDSSSGNATYQYKSSAWVALETDVSELEGLVMEIIVEQTKLAAEGTLTSPTYDTADADVFTDADGVNDTVDTGSTTALYNTTNDYYASGVSLTGDLDDCDSLDGWTGAGAGATASVNTDVKKQGTGSITLTADGDNDEAQYYRTKTLTATDVFCFVRFEGVLPNEGYCFHLEDGSSNTLAMIRCKAGANLYYSGGWLDLHTSGNFTTDTWYIWRIEKVDSTHFNAYAYDENGVLVGSQLNKAVVGGSWGTSVLCKLGVMDESATPIIARYDAISSGWNYSDSLVYTDSISSFSGTPTKVFVYAETTTGDDSSVTVDIDVDADDTYEYTEQSLGSEISITGAGSAMKLKFRLNVSTDAATTPTISNYCIFYWT